MTDHVTPEEARQFADELDAIGGRAVAKMLRSLAAQLEEAQEREAQRQLAESLGAPSYVDLTDEIARLEAVAPEEYGLRAAKRQLKKDNASLVEQNLALRSKVSVLATQLEATEGQRKHLSGLLMDAQERERVLREALEQIEQLDRMGHNSEVAAEMGYIARDALDSPQTQGG